MPTMPNTKTSPPIRIASLDLARGFAILFMVLIHVLDFYGLDNAHYTFIGQLIHWLGSYPAAPVFMLIMGVFIMMSKQSIQQGLKRAVWLFTLGYILNIVRLAIPMWIVISSGISDAPELAYHTPLIEFFIGDILQFAGLAYACGVILKHYCPNLKVLFIITLAITFISPYLWDIHTDVRYVNEFIKLLWGDSEHGSMFPVFPWLAYPLTGMILGYHLLQTSQTNLLFKQVFLAGITITVLGFIITINNPEWHIGYFLRGGPGATMTNIGLVLIWLSCCQFIVQKTPHNSLFSLLYFWSRNVTTIYIIQWLIIGWGLIGFGFNQLTLGQTLIMMTATLVSSDQLTRYWLKLKAAKHTNSIKLDSINNNE